MYGFTTIPTKILVIYFVDIIKSVLKFIWRSKTPRKVTNFEGYNKIGGLILPDFKTYYKATTIRQCGLDERRDTQINGTVERVQK